LLDLARDIPDAERAAALERMLQDQLQPLLNRGSTRAALKEMYAEGRFVGAGLRATALEALDAMPVGCRRNEPRRVMKSAPMPRLVWKWEDEEDDGEGIGPWWVVDGDDEQGRDLGSSLGGRANGTGTWLRLRRGRVAHGNRLTAVVRNQDGPVHVRRVFTGGTAWTS
jgi:hypothetical protein